MIVCWSAKGGVGTTVVAAALALSIAKRHNGAVLVDAAGDVAAAVGIAESETVGVCQWLSAADDVPTSALDRLSVSLPNSLSVLPSGTLEGDLVVRRTQVERLRDAFSEPVVVDAGVARREGDAAHELAVSAEESVLVTRACYLALRRASQLSLKPSAVILVEEPGRSLDRRDVESVVGAPVVATVPWEVAVARAVDAGRLTSKRIRALRQLELLDFGGARVN